MAFASRIEFGRPKEKVNEILSPEAAQSAFEMLFKPRKPRTPEAKQVE